MQVNGQPYVFGGYNGKACVNTIYTFDTTANAWSERALMPKALADHNAVAINYKNNTAFWDKWLVKR